MFEWQELPLKFNVAAGALEAFEKVRQDGRGENGCLNPNPGRGCRCLMRRAEKKWWVGARIHTMGCPSITCLL